MCTGEMASTNDVVYTRLDADEASERVTEIESMCPQCQENVRFIFLP